MNMQQQVLRFTIQLDVTGSSTSLPERMMASTSSSQFHARATAMRPTGVSVGTGVGTAVC
jgi:hypothetical protein